MHVHSVLISRKTGRNTHPTSMTSAAWPEQQVQLPHTMKPMGKNYLQILPFSAEQLGEANVCDAEKGSLVFQIARRFGREPSWDTFTRRTIKPAAVTKQTPLVFPPQLWVWKGPFLFPISYNCMTSSQVFIVGALYVQIINDCAAKMNEL